MLNNAFPIKSSRVIIDTCVFQYLNNKWIRSKLFDLLKILEKNNNSLMASEISTAELLSECSKEKEKELLKIWKPFPKYQIVRKVTMATARLATLYRYEKGVEQEAISLADKIIGATAILTGSYILTADVNHFPRPFFDEKYKERVFYKKKGGERMMCFYIFRADYKTIAHRFKHRP